MGDYGTQSFKDQSFTPTWKKKPAKPLRSQWWFWVLLLVLLPLILVGVAIMLVMIVLTVLI